MQNYVPVAESLGVLTKHCFLMCRIIKHLGGVERELAHGVSKDGRARQGRGSWVGEKVSRE